MKVLIAASEATPYAKTGGLADVAGALFREYRRMNVEATLILPLYKTIRPAFELRDTGQTVTVPVGGRWFQGRIFSHEQSVFFVECDAFFDRDDLYGTAAGDYPDNDARFIFFSRALIDACRALSLKPDVIHCNDWQTGLVPLYRTIAGREDLFSATATLLTIHNLGYQGVFEAAAFYLTGLPGEYFNPEGIEFYGKVNFLKAGLISADVITTVSTTYAHEILTPEFGYGLDGVLRKYSQKLSGVINGIDRDAWDPADDTFIAAPFSQADPGGKERCREELLRECMLQGGGNGRTPVVSFIGRLSAQKGLDILIESIDEIVSLGGMLIVLGRGEERFHSALQSAAGKHPGKVYVKIGFSESLAHRVYAGSDIFLMPSHYEPCGLGQIIAMRYGTIPVARKTGGLVDTIADYEPLTGRGTGFIFRDYRASALVECLKRAFTVYGDTERWNRLIAHAMEQDFSWERSADEYLKLYESALSTRRHTL